MHNHRSRLGLAALLAGLAAALGGCGGGAHPASSPPAARLVHSHGSSKIVLTQLGAQRIGLETVRAGRARGSGSTIPLGAVIYDPSGKTYAFVAAGRLTYVEVPVRVDELYGVQTGVLGQT
jgi:hypothetical protein